MIPISLIDADLSQVPQSKVDEIKESLSSIGLLHPITVRANGERYELVAGKKRLKAFIDLKETEIPAQIDNSKVTSLEVSIEENLKRTNLEWYLQVELELQLHELRIDQHGLRRTGRNASKEAGWSQMDTARELGVALGSMSQDLMLANAVRRNPHLAKIQDKQTALRLVREAAKREHIEEATLAPDIFEMNQVFCGNSAEVLKEIPDYTFNVCITDPPWIDYKDPSLTRDEQTLPVFKEIYRTLQRDSLLYAVVSTPDFYFYLKELPKFGFQVQEYPLIWDKSGVMTHGKKAWEYSRAYEPIILAAKGSPVLNVGTQVHPIFKFTPVHSTKLVHPHEKPTELIKELLKHSTFDGARVLDPFSGSGATLVAAKEMKRKYIGIERNHSFYEKIVKRLG